MKIGFQDAWGSKFSKKYEIQVLFYSIEYERRNKGYTNILLHIRSERSIFSH